MKNIFTSISIWAGVIVAVLTVTDWLLTDSQKKWLTRQGDHIWLWLSYQRMGSFIDTLKTFKTQFLLSVITYFLFIICVMLIASDVSLHPLWLGYLAIISWKIHPRVVSWITSTESLTKFFLRCLSALFISFIAALVSSAVAIGILILISFLDPSYVFYNGEPNTFATVLLYVIVLPANLEAGLIQTILILSLGWFIIILLLMILFRIIQFVLIRIVDSPKGPVLGMSGLLIGIGALIKAFL